MRIKILVSMALINEEKGRWAGLAEELDVPKGRGEYLISVGAAKSLEDDAEDPGPEAETEAPQGDDGKAAGTSTTEVKPETGEKKPEPEPDPTPEPEVKPVPEQKAAPVRRPAPKTK